MIEQQPVPAPTPEVNDPRWSLTPRQKMILGAVTFSAFLAGKLAVPLLVEQIGTVPTACLGLGGLVGGTLYFLHQFRNVGKQGASSEQPPDHTS